MAVTREQLQDTLAQLDSAVLTAILESSGVRLPSDRSAESLSAAIVRTLWWRSHSPLGLLMADDFDTLVARTVKKLGLTEEIGSDDPYVQVREIAAQLLPDNEPLSYEGLPREARKRLKRGVVGQWLGLSAAGGSAGAGWAAVEFIKLTAPIKGWLPFIPKVGPVVIGLRKGAGAIATISSPVGISLAVLSINSALGAEHDRALPLLLGIGLAVGQEGQVPVEATVVDGPVPDGELEDGTETEPDMSVFGMDGEPIG